MGLPDLLFLEIVTCHPFIIFFVCVCSCICGVQLCKVDVGHLPQVFPFLDFSLSLDLELTSLATQTDQQAPGLSSF